MRDLKKGGGVKRSFETLYLHDGVYFESTGYPSKHINQICKTSYFSLYKISKIQSLLNQASTEELIHAFITSRLDYCNSVLYGSPDYEIKKLQSIQNSAA